MTKLKIGKRSGLKYFDIEDIRSWKPCYDPMKYLPENWRGTALTILKNEAIPFADRLWVVCRSEIASDRTLRLFAVWCARKVQHLMSDKRSIDAIEVAERFANGQATQAELDSARTAAREAARDVVGMATIWAAAQAAAYSAAGDAAREAARDAAKVASWAAGDAAWDATSDAATATAQAAQREKLIEMLIAEGKERLK